MIDMRQMREPRLTFGVDDPRGHHRYTVRQSRYGAVANDINDWARAAKLGDRGAWPPAGSIWTFVGLETRRQNVLSSRPPYMPMTADIRWSWGSVTCFGD